MGRSPMIIVVDDEPDMLQYIREILDVQENDSERLTIEKAHFGTKVCDCDRTIDG